MVYGICYMVYGIWNNGMMHFFSATNKSKWHVQQKIQKKYSVSVLGHDWDILSNITLCLKDFPGAKPEGTPEGKGRYLTVYPESSPNTVII